MSERLSERERIRAILLNKTPLEAADWHLAEVKRIIDVLKIARKYILCEGEIKVVKAVYIPPATKLRQAADALEQKERDIALIDETIKLLGGGI